MGGPGGKGGQGGYQGSLEWNGMELEDITLQVTYLRIKKRTVANLSKCYIFKVLLSIKLKIFEDFKVGLCEFYGTLVVKH